VSEPVKLVDFLPTLLGMSGFSFPGDPAGHSLLPLITSEISHWRPACFSEIDHSMSMYDELRADSGRRLMVRTREWKLIYFKDCRLRNTDGALYNLRNDPGEHHNLYHKPGLKKVIGYLENLAEEWDRSTSVR
ncbi:MAG TPA: sulfatase/phosphatase domain-containing protein, partial [bacterium]|nr:sulfatase/phosphatase domain-containing protein [bacterium]